MILSRVLLLAGLFLSLWSPTATAADAAPAAEAASVPTARASARATMRTFLTAVADADGGQDERLQDAVDCLDLSDIPASARGDRGHDLVIKLKGAIDRIRLVDYATIPDERDGKPYVFWSNDALGRIALAPTSAGDWRFDKATVGRIDDLYRALEHKRVVAGAAGSAAGLSPALWLRSRMPDSLKQVGFMLEHWQWLALVLLIILGVLLARAIRWVLVGPVRRWLERRKWSTPQRLLTRALRPTGFIVMAILWTVGLRWIGLPAGFHGVLIVIVKFLAAVGVVWFLYRVIDIVAHHLDAKADRTVGRFDDLLVPLFRKSAKVIVTAVGVVFISDVVGITPSSLIATLGLGGLAIALAAQDTVKNFFGSLTVILDRPFEVGDAVIIGGNTEGVIEEVGFRSTRIRTYENSLITLPNANLISAKVDNLGRRNFRRFKTTIQIHADTPPDQVVAFCEGVRGLIAAQPLTREGDETVFLHNLGASGLDILVITHFHTTSGGEALEARHALLLDIITLAGQLGVALPYPTQTLLVQQLDGANGPPKGPITPS